MSSSHSGEDFGPKTPPSQPTIQVLENVVMTSSAGTDSELDSTLSPSMDQIKNCFASPPQSQFTALSQNSVSLNLDQFGSPPNNAWPSLEESRTPVKKADQQQFSAMTKDDSMAIPPASSAFWQSSLANRIYTVITIFAPPHLSFESENCSNLIEIDTVSFTETPMKLENLKNSAKARTSSRAGASILENPSRDANSSFSTKTSANYSNAGSIVHDLANQDKLSNDASQIAPPAESVPIQLSIPSKTSFEVKRSYASIILSQQSGNVLRPADSLIRKTAASPISDSAVKLPELVSKSGDGRPTSPCLPTCYGFSTSTTIVKSENDFDSSTSHNPVVVVKWSDEIKENSTFTVPSLETPQKNDPSISNQDQSSIEIPSISQNSKDEDDLPSLKTDMIADKEEAHEVVKLHEKHVAVAEPSTIHKPLSDSSKKDKTADSGAGIISSPSSSMSMQLSIPSKTSFEVEQSYASVCSSQQSGNALTPADPSTRNTAVSFINDSAVKLPKLVSKSDGGRPTFQFKPIRYGFSTSSTIVKPKNYFDFSTSENSVRIVTRTKKNGANSMFTLLPLESPQKNAPSISNQDQSPIEIPSIPQNSEDEDDLPSLKTDMIADKEEAHEVVKLHEKHVAVAEPSTIHKPLSVSSKKDKTIDLGAGMISSPNSSLSMQFSFPSKTSFEVKRSYASLVLSQQSGNVLRPADSLIRKTSASPISDSAVKLPELVSRSDDGRPTSPCLPTFYGFSTSTTIVKSNNDIDPSTSHNPDVVMKWSDEIEENSMFTVPSLESPQKNAPSISNQDRSPIEIPSIPQSSEDEDDLPGLETDTVVDKKEAHEVVKLHEKQVAVVEPSTIHKPLSVAYEKDKTIDLGAGMISSPNSSLSMQLSIPSKTSFEVEQSYASVCSSQQSGNALTPADSSTRNTAVFPISDSAVKLPELVMVVRHLHAYRHVMDSLHLQTIVKSENDFDSSTSHNPVVVVKWSDEIEEKSMFTVPSLESPQKNGPHNFNQDPSSVELSSISQNSEAEDDSPIIETDIIVKKENAHEVVKLKKKYVAELSKIHEVLCASYKHDKKVHSGAGGSSLSNSSLSNDSLASSDLPTFPSTWILPSDFYVKDKNYNFKKKWSTALLDKGNIIKPLYYPNKTAKTKTASQIFPGLPLVSKSNLYTKSDLHQIVLTRCLPIPERPDKDLIAVVDFISQEVRDRMSELEKFDRFYTAAEKQDEIVNLISRIFQRFNGRRIKFTCSQNLKKIKNHKNRKFSDF